MFDLIKMSIFYNVFFSAQLQRRGQQRVTDRVVNAVIASEGGMDKCHGH